MQRRKARSVTRAAPRERGWTLAHRRMKFTTLGRPARAGMDPGMTTTAGRCGGPPRASGDGPLLGSSTLSAFGAAPRERGWTLAKLSSAELADGRPARAGMDPASMCRCGGAVRPPRASGDGPQRPGGSSSCRPAAPRERGWTLMMNQPRMEGPGRPARAGMDRAEGRLSAQGRRPPRASGDGPSRHAAIAPKNLAAPRERGWTPPDFIGQRVMQGRPARAGMDPVHQRCRAICRWPPRASGDGPVSRWVSVISAAAAPRERGWTPDRHQARRTAGGRPARAGMDPSGAIRGGVACRPPRASGDGPGPGLPGNFPLRAAPRERGWTLEPAVPGVAGSGRPARAGMDPTRIC